MRLMLVWVLLVSACADSALDKLEAGEAKFDGARDYYLGFQYDINGFVAQCDYGQQRIIVQKGAFVGSRHERTSGLSDEECNFVSGAVILPDDDRYVAKTMHDVYASCRSALDSTSVDVSSDDVAYDRDGVLTRCSVHYAEGVQDAVDYDAAPKLFGFGTITEDEATVWLQTENLP